MRVCIGSTGDGGPGAKVAPDFLSAPSYTIFDTDTGETMVLSNDVTSTRKGTPSKMIADSGVQVMLTRGLERDAMRALGSRGVMVFCGAQGSVVDAMKAFEDGDLTPTIMTAADVKPRVKRSGSRDRALDRLSINR